MTSRIFGMALGAAAVAAILAATPALAQTSVSISVGQPGFYGRLNVGDFVGRPLVYGPRPVIIDRGVRYGGGPIYLRVPPFERRHWARYCGRYAACGLPVLFVQDDWYVNTYVPRYRQHFGPRPHGPVRVIERGGYHGGPGPGFRHDGPRGHEGPDRGHYDGGQRGGPGGDRGHGGGGGGRGEGHGGGDHGGDHGGGDHGHR